jgi:hypothetical protein
MARNFTRSIRGFDGSSGSSRTLRSYFIHDSSRLKKRLSTGFADAVEAEGCFLMARGRTAAAFLSAHIEV